ncbi:ABC transporter ATP-binding protein [Thermus composti]|uniref:ABC transporter ATP-binding protein n=1 Tax=Thermus composti TaxID=532059 RepID=A0ABV6Q063_9DEIN|nr:ABC transporter ATP-binding protein [Thermus composti]GGN04464.1 ABC transporter ATP-binding protein [Thermus composti]
MRKALAAEHLTKAFGRLLAVNGVSLEVAEGSVHAVIGPNGAGKTTLFALLSGALRPDRGRVFLFGREVTHLPPEKRVRLGLSRTFQVPQVFPNLTVKENLQIALEAARGLSPYPWLRRKDRLAVEERIQALLERLGLEEKAQRTVGELAHGDQRIVEVGLALSLGARLLLLDEPTAGMSDEETWRTVELLKVLHREEGITLLFIEHDMEVVFGLAERVTVLHLGEVLAEGTPEAIAADERVQAAYLGEVVRG